MASFSSRIALECSFASWLTLGSMMVQKVKNRAYIKSREGLTVQGGLVTAHNVVRVLALPVPITRLLGLRIGLELVDRLAGMFLRLIGDVGVVDGGLCAFVSYDTMARCTKTRRTLWPPIWRVGRDMFTIGGLRCRWVVRVVGRVR